MYFKRHCEAISHHFKSTNACSLVNCLKAWARTSNISTFFFLPISDTKKLIKIRINTVLPDTHNSHPLNQFRTESTRVPSLNPLISGCITLRSRAAALHIISSCVMLYLFSKHNRANQTSRRLLPKYIYLLFSAHHRETLFNGKRP